MYFGEEKQLLPFLLLWQDLAYVLAGLFTRKWEGNYPDIRAGVDPVGTREMSADGGNRKPILLVVL
jgi:hypothetical protein